MKSQRIIWSIVLISLLSACNSVQSQTPSKSVNTTSLVNTTSVASGTVPAQVSTAAQTLPQTAPQTAPQAIPGTKPVSVSVPSTAAIASAEESTEDDQLLKDIIGYTDFTLGDWFTVSLDNEHKMIRLDPNAISKTTFIMIEDSSGPMKEQWEEMKSKVLYSEQICIKLPDYSIGIFNWGDRSDSILFEAQGGEVAKDYLTTDG